MIVDEFPVTLSARISGMICGITGGAACRDHLGCRKLVRVIQEYIRLDINCRRRSIPDIGDADIEFQLAALIARRSEIYIGFNRYAESAGLRSVGRMNGLADPVRDNRILELDAGSRIRESQVIIAGVGGARRKPGVDRRLCRQICPKMPSTANPSPKYLYGFRKAVPV